ncbi:MAG TPA: hypothetical protein PKH14_12825 [Syntrophorhabdus sp.]|mgnify:CR=1 FL=1|nr:hypothetical protein [Syntrophorhabdus sp.]
MTKKQHLQLVQPGIPLRAIYERAWMIGPDELLRGEIALKAIERDFPHLLKLTDEQRAMISEALYQQGVIFTFDDARLLQHMVEKSGGTGPCYYDSDGMNTTPRSGDVVIEIPDGISLMAIITREQDDNS